ncbi:hypothetical protein V6U81_19485 [Micromonospora sp. CPCC 205711]|uniref:hypothetical protein n=1 Tax=Micromonospora sp. CPCC 205547 TaxID=3122400 RepID=UPI002FF1B03E
MSFHNRPLARLGAASLLAAGALAAFGAPAHAAGTETDLSLDVVGTRVATNAGEKIAFAKVRNLGQNTPSELFIHADLAGFDYSKFTIWPLDTDNCNPEGDREGVRAWTCAVPQDQLPGPGETLEFPLLAFKANSTATSYSGDVTYTISSKDDTNPANNTRVGKLEFTAEQGVDLGVLVSDVTKAVEPPADDPEAPNNPPLYPGDTTKAFGTLVNQGDRTTDGVRLTIKLPKGVTFAVKFTDCVHSADNRTATCDLTDLQLAEGGDALYFQLPIQVAADVKAPVALKPGTVTAVALGQLDPDVKPLAPAKPKLPAGMKLAPAHEIDPSDNSDDFAVIVAAKPNGGGGGTGGDSGNGGGGLPVTGPQAGLIGGVGVAAAIAGGVLFLAARRRRVVLVTPGDEKSTA